jgi:hypothetical protein
MRASWPSSESLPLDAGGEAGERHWNHTKTTAFTDAPPQQRPVPTLEPRAESLAASAPWIGLGLRGKPTATNGDGLASNERRRRAQSFKLPE